MEHKPSSPGPLRSSKRINANANISPPLLSNCNANTMDDAQNNIGLTKRNFLLELQFQELRQKIKPLFDVLGKTLPKSDLEKILMTWDGDSDEHFELSLDIIKETENLLKKLSMEVEEKIKISQALWSEVNEFWTELEMKAEPSLAFTNAHIGILEALKSLKTEYLKRKEERKERITLFIIDLRSELAEIWKQCLISEEEKYQFSPFHSTNFTEELLDLHKEELAKLKIYHEKNQVIFEKMKQRQEMWKKLRELETRSSDPSRFVNRGGSLLKDQKDHASIMKSLPKLENELKKLTDQFELEHGRPVTIYNQDIHTIINRDWKSFNEEKQNKKLDSKSKMFNSRQSIMPPPPPKLPEKRSAAKPALTPNPKRKCMN